MKGLLYTIAAAVILVIGFMAVAQNAHRQMPATQQTASNQAITATACGGVGRGGGACTAQ